MLSAAEPAKKRIAVHGRSVAYGETGNGDPILFLHGRLIVSGNDLARAMVAARSAPPPCFPCDAMRNRPSPAAGSPGRCLRRLLVATLAGLLLTVGLVIDWLPRGGHASAHAEGQPATMAQKLSAKLSPKAKKALMIGGDQPVVGLVTMAPNADRAELERAIGALGGAVQTWDRTTALAAVEVPAAKLGELADLDAVVYIEIGETYRP